MAKIVPVLGSMSGSLGGAVFSHNRGGAYVRARRIPVNPSATKQQSIRNILSALSASWASLTDTQRSEWNQWAALNPVVDTLGQSIQLSGQQAYVGLNSRRGLSALAALTTCPAGTGPAVLETASAVLTSPSTIVITYTPTPLAAGNRLAVWGTLPSTAGRNPNRNQARLLGISGAAAASTQTVTSPYPAVVAQVSNLWVAVIDLQGRISPGLAVRAAWG